MSLQIANPKVVAKIAKLAKAKGMTKTALVERAVDALAAEGAPRRQGGRIEKLLAQIDQVPDRPDAYDPLLWDEQGLPR